MERRDIGDFPRCGGGEVGMTEICPTEKICGLGGGLNWSGFPLCIARKSSKD